MKRTALLFILFSLLITCKKNIDPVANTDSSFFFVKGSLNNQDFKIEAGIDSFYLFTNYSGTFVSEFKKPCADCKESLKISLLSPRYKKDGPFLFDSIFGLDLFDYSFKNDLSRSYAVSLVARPKGAGTLASQLWTFSDGTSSNLANPTKVFSGNNSYGVNYWVEYITPPAQRCTTSINKVFNFMAQDSLSDSTYRSIPKISSYFDTTNLKTFFFLTDTINSISCSWTFGDGDTASGFNVSHKYNTPGQYEAKANLVLKGNIPWQLNERVGYLDNSCIANFDYTVTPLGFIGNTKTLIVIEYTDKNGVKYNSQIAEQNSNTFFKIISKKEHEPNEKGQKTTAFEVAFYCKLSNGTQTIDFITSKAKIAFAHP